MSGDIPTVSLSRETEDRYFKYAMSVITARALPDVRDGLKPVQRRIIYTMFADLHLGPDARFRKCAKVVGDVMGNYHPHGDAAIYDAMVRMAQDFSLRYPLVDGQGNFGSLDGDPAAHFRYTECRLRPLAGELMEEIRSRTVDWRPSYDGTRSEPIVLPARMPNLLLNGTQGIAVGMATSIPPHNFGEVIDACIALVDEPELESKDLLKYIKGPDFPTGGQLLASKRDLKEVYEAGSGSFKLRAEWEVEEPKGRKQSPTLVITSIPYGPTKQSIVEKLGELVRDRKLPQMTDVLDQSTTDVRIEIELKKDADPALVMAYLYKNTPLSISVQVNLTCLVPTENPDVTRPEQLNLRGCLRHFLDFRNQVVRRRLEFDRAELQKRIHLLDGFAKIYDALDEVLRIIRKSEGKQDAAQKLIKRFELDEEQADAILELKLYRLARLEILLIQKELADKKKSLKHIEGILKSETKVWSVVKDELTELRGKYDDKRRTKVSVSADEPEFSAEAFIVDEDANVVVTRDGWVKRVRELKDPTATRTREGDEVVAVLPGNTRNNVAFFTNFGSCYVCRINDVPASTGYGDPVQKLFKFDDGERVVGAISLDARVRPPEVNFVAVSKNGYGLRFAIQPHTELSTRSGRKFARVGEGDEIVGVRPAPDDAILVVATDQAHALVCKLDEVNILAGVGRGVTVIKTRDDEAVVGFTVNDTLVVEGEKGKTEELKPLKGKLVARGGKGTQFWRKEKVARAVPPPVTIPTLGPPDAPPGAGGMKN